MQRKKLVVCLHHMDVCSLVQVCDASLTSPGEERRAHKTNQLQGA